VINVKRVVEEWEIWDEEGEAAKSEEEAKKLVVRHSSHLKVKVYGVGLDMHRV